MKKYRYGHLPMMEQIQKLERDNKIMWICAIVLSFVLVAGIILLFIYSSAKLLAMGLVYVLPISLWKTYMAVRENECIIEQLSETIEKLESEFNP